MGTTNCIFSRVHISQVYQDLTGIKPRGHGEKWRAPAPWRDTSDCNLSLHDGKGTWYDFVAAEGGGLVDLVVRVRGGGRKDALRWLADLSGVPLDDRPISPAERERWVRQKILVKRYLHNARYWRRTALALGEEVLDRLKCDMVDPVEARPPEFGELQAWTRRLAFWQRIDGAELVNEYCEWAARHPRITASMVRVAQDLESAEMQALQKYLGIAGEAGA